MKILCIIASLALITGCVGTFDYLPPSRVIESPQAIVVAHNRWSIVLLPRWKYIKVHVEEKSLTRVLEAHSPYNIGDRPVRFTLSTVPYAGSEVGFAQANIAALQNSELPGWSVINTRIVNIDDRPAALVIMVNKEHGKHIGQALVALAGNGTGYVMTCGGDIFADGRERIINRCMETVVTFKIR